MILSDTSIRRPVFAIVLNLLLVTFGIVAFTKLQVREFPDIDPPIVTIETSYTGASAAVVERRITQLIEDRISVVEAIKSIESSSEDGRSLVTVEFNIERDIDDAANDLREAVSSLLDELPDEADPPEITKEDSATEVMMWLSLTSNYLTPVELADYADRYLVDSFSVLPGVARIRISGASSYAMRVWIDRQALAARNLTVTDVEQALSRQNVELPAGTIQSLDRQFTVRIKRGFLTEEEFRNLVIVRGDNGFLVRLGEVARVELGAEEPRRTYRGNGVPRVGMGIIKQSQANTLDVSHAAKAELERVRKHLPDGIYLDESYDTSVFIEESLKQVGSTLGIAVLLVILVIYLFLGNGPRHAHSRRDRSSITDWNVHFHECLWILDQFADSARVDPRDWHCRRRCHRGPRKRVSPHRKWGKSSLGCLSRDPAGWICRHRHHPCSSCCVCPDFVLRRSPREVVHRVCNHARSCGLLLEFCRPNTIPDARITSVESNDHTRQLADAIRGQRFQ
jgi:multidrug efflux pump subunit AcrB